jgi:hypothetical protein
VQVSQSGPATALARRDGGAIAATRETAGRGPAFALGRVPVRLGGSAENRPVVPTLLVLAVDLGRVIHEDLDLRHGAAYGPSTQGGGASLILGDPYVLPVAAERGTLVDRYV